MNTVDVEHIAPRLKAGGVLPATKNRNPIFKGGTLYKQKKHLSLIKRLNKKPAINVHTVLSSIAPFLHAPHERGGVDNQNPPNIHHSRKSPTNYFSTVGKRGLISILDLWLCCRYQVS